MDTKKPLLEAHHISKQYMTQKSILTVLHNINLSLLPGEMYGIIGASGAGKSTLLHILGGLDLPTQGTLRIHNNNVYQLSDKKRSVLINKHIGFVFQFFNLLNDFSLLENVALPALISTPSYSRKRCIFQKAKDLLHMVGLGHRLQHKPSELSGGEQQRGALARALINEPSLILADEPTGNLDSQNGSKIYEIFQSLTLSLKQTFLIVTHDERLAGLIKHCMYISDGQLFFSKGDIPC